MQTGEHIAIQQVTDHVIRRVITSPVITWMVISIEGADPAQMNAENGGGPVK